MDSTGDSVTDAGSALKPWLYLAGGACCLAVIALIVGTIFLVRYLKKRSR